MANYFKYSTVLLVSLFLYTNCGNPQGVSLNAFDSASISRQTDPGLASCNAADVSGVYTAGVEHPVSGGIVDQNHLLMKIKTLNPAFMSGNNSIQFFRVQYALDAAGNQQMEQDNNALMVNIVSGGGNTAAYAITPASISAAGVSAPFYVILTGTDVPWQEINVVVTMNGGTTPGQFLIPDFDADPMLYRYDHAKFPGLYQIHPFYSSIGTYQDYVSLSGNFCF